MESSSPKIKKFLIIFQKAVFLIFQEIEELCSPKIKKISCVIFLFFKSF